MKFTLKALLILFIGVLSFTSCENEETIIEDIQQNPTEESESIVTALNKMSSNFDQSGNVNVANSPSGNIVFDFCFDFVYPITLSYNTGATVSVNDLNELVTVLTNSTDQLFINGISFPFDVETFDDTTNSIVIVTINNETEFSDLLVSCDFQDAPSCNCPDVYDPVCVEITDPNGNLVTITYPNDCFALCDGFTAADIIDDCDGNDYFDFGFGCFTLNYPIDLILDDGSTITINDDDEFGNAMYNQYVVNFVFPLSVTLEEDGSVVTVNNETEFETVFNNCFDFPTNDFPCTDDQILEQLTLCNTWSYTKDGLNYYIIFDLNDNSLAVYNDSDNIIHTSFWHISNDSPTEGPVLHTNLPFYGDWAFYGCNTGDGVEVISSGDGFDDIEPDCNNNPDDCTEQDVLDALIDCDTWSADVNGTTFQYEFDINTGLVDVIDDQDNVVTSGDFEIIEEAATGNVFILIVTSSQNFSDAWFFFDCDTPNPQIQSASGEIVSIVSDCD